MGWIRFTDKGFLHRFGGHGGAGRNLGRILRGVGRTARSRMRSSRPRRDRRGCCCCPAFFILGLAGMGLIAGFLYAGIRLLGWA
jgi:hypothetical protein